MAFAESYRGKFFSERSGVSSQVEVDRKQRKTAMKQDQTSLSEAGGDSSAQSDAQHIISKDFCVGLGIVKKNSIKVPIR